MLDVLYHATNYNVVYCKHVVLEGCEDHVIFLHLFLLVLHYQEIAVNVFHVDVGIFVVIQLVEIGCNYGLLDFIKTLEVKVSIIVQEFLIALLKNILSL